MALFEGVKLIEDSLSKLLETDAPVDFFVNENTRVVKNEHSFKFIYSFGSESLNNYSKFQDNISKGSIDVDSFPCFDLLKFNNQKIVSIIGENFLGIFKGQYVHLAYKSGIVISNTKSISEYFEVIQIKQNIKIQLQTCKFGYFLPIVQGMNLNKLVELIARALKANSLSGNDFHPKLLPNDNSVTKISYINKNDFTEVSKIQSEFGVFTLHGNNVLIGQFNDMINIWIFIDDDRMKVIQPNGESQTMPLSSPSDFGKYISAMRLAYKEMTTDPNELERERQVWIEDQKVLQQVIRNNESVLKFVNNS